MTDISVVEVLVEPSIAVVEVAIPGIQGPQGPPGSGGGAGSTVITQSTPAATWILSHTIGRVPAVSVYLASGEQVDTDVVASASTVTVTFATPQTGFVILS